MFKLARWATAVLLLVISTGSISYGQDDSKVSSSTTTTVGIQSKALRVTNLISQKVSLSDEQYTRVYNALQSELSSGKNDNWGHVKQALNNVLDKNQMKQVQSIKKDITAVLNEESPYVGINDSDKKDKKEKKEKNKDANKNSDDGGKKSKNKRREGEK